MIRNKYFPIAVILILMMAYSPGVSAQLNFSVGFTTARSNAEQLNAIVKEYNDTLMFEEEIGSLVWLNGVNLGFRQKFDNLSVFVAWNNSRRTKSGFKEDDNNALFEKTLKYTMNTYEIGAENYMGFFAYGFSLGKRSFVIKTPIASSDKDRVISSDAQWISRFHISLNSQGGSYSSIALKPFVEFAWNDNDLSDFNNELITTKPTVMDRIHLIGVSIIFYNGGQ